MKSRSIPFWRSAFTLIELLVVIVIIAILTAIALPVINKVLLQSRQLKTTSNMKQMGAGLLAYANDNNYQLPNRASTAGLKWPALLQPYVVNLNVYASPIPDYQGKSYTVTDTTKYLDATKNYTSYIYNGCNDLGALGNETVYVRLNNISSPAQTILLGVPYPQLGQFYMDFSENGGNNNDILNKNAFTTGTPYVFCDGSARYLINNALSTANKKNAPPTGDIYTDWLWLMDKSRTDLIQ